MSTINLANSGEGCWPELEAVGANVIDLTEQPLDMAFLETGTEAGKPSVALKFRLPDGSFVFWQCGMELWLNTNETLRTKFRK